ncbi:alpha/beta fold hydrolase [Paenibacillus swuensis]|nr:alpha/beta hydrolase [Paenibacillus swuensis]
MNQITEAHNDQEIGIVFIHGAGLNSSIWDAVISEMEVPCLAVHYPGRSGDERSLKSLTINDYVAHMTAQIERWGVRKFVIVAHSLGGALGLKVAEVMGERVKGYIAVGAAIPKDGGSFLSILPFPNRLIMGIMLRLLGTKPPESAIKQSLCHDLTSEQTETIARNFVADSARIYLDRYETHAPDVPKLYVKLAEDRDLSLPIQESAAANLKADDTITLPCGHLPMLSQPQALSEALRTFLDNKI